MFGLFGKSPVTLTPAEVKAAMEAGSICLVDVREAGEWAAGHVPGAMHVPLSRLADEAARLPGDRPVVFYCAAGGRSGQAVQLMRRLNLPHERHMGGGIGAWRAHGFPLA